MSDNRVKVLVSGAVMGRFSTFSKKLEMLHNSKAGPFDICFCVGPFFDDNDCIASPNLRDEAIALLSSCKGKSERTLDLPTPVYFTNVGRVPVGVDLVESPAADNTIIDGKVYFSPPPVDKDEILLEEYPEQSTIKTRTGCNGRSIGNGVTKIANNLYRLNGTDIISLQPGGLVVAYTSSTHVRFGTDETKSLEQKAKHVNYIGCDLFLSSEWAQGMASLHHKVLTSTDKERLKQAILDNATILPSTSCDHTIEIKLSELGSYDIAEMASIVRPRYHFSSTSSALGNQYIASNAFDNIPSVTNDTVHICRFISLGNVISKEEEKLLTNSKNRKYIHAVGIVPLLLMSRSALKDRPPGTVMSPYGYLDAPSSTSNSTYLAPDKAQSHNLTKAVNVPLPGITLSEQQFRWGGGGVTNSGIVSDALKRKSVCSGEQQLTGKELAEQDILAKAKDNKCLFVHGLDKDKTGGILVNMGSLLEAFKEYGCVRIRIPKRLGGIVSSYAFAEFQTHEQALSCLIKSNRIISVSGILLALKWSSVGTIVTSSSSSHSDRSCYQLCPGVIPSMPESKRRRLTEQESQSSDTLFCKLPSSVQASEFQSLFEALRVMAEQCLEDAINVDAPEGATRILVKDEPALAVAVSHPDARKGFGFLVFASHAAATLVLTSLTGSNDGGIVNSGCLSSGRIYDITSLDKIEGTFLYWARGAPPGTHASVCSHAENSSLNSAVTLRKPKFLGHLRTDCWFCIASPTCEKHLILAIKECCYITMPKGAISPFHCLIVPIEHKSQGVLLYEENTLEEVEVFKEQLRRHAKEELRQRLFIFERAIQTKGGYHTHIQCIPLEQEQVNRLYNTLMVMSKEAGFELKELKPSESVTPLIIEKEAGYESGYFYAEIPVLGEATQRRFICLPSPDNTKSSMSADFESAKLARSTVPLQFGRSVTAKVMGRPELTEWKNCILSEEEEAKLANSFRASLSKYG